MTDVDNTLRDHGVYHVSVTVAYGAFVFAANEEEAKTKALDMDFKDMRMNDDVSVDVELADVALTKAQLLDPVEEAL